MRRRAFIKALGIGSLGAGLGYSLPVFANTKLSKADYSVLDHLDALAYNPSSSVDKIPRVITVFLSGGASELAGNLSNIGEINQTSVNPYGPQFDPGASNTVVTTNALWRGAGGDIMEEMLANKQMSIYRTVNRIKDNSRSHGPSVTQNLVGNLDQSNPGIGTSIARLLMMHNELGQPLFAGKPLEELMFPIVSFHGENPLYQLGNANISPTLRPVTLSYNLNNPFRRSRNYRFNQSTFDSFDGSLDKLAQKVSRQHKSLSDISDSFARRKAQGDSIDQVLSRDKVNLAIEHLNIALLEGEKINYDDYGRFGQRVKAAVSLMLNNHETLFASLGSDGLGGWDDHSGALDEYPARMVNLMGAIRAGMRHIEAVKAQGLPRFDDSGAYLNSETIFHADNIIIDVFGDFGRIVNLNKPSAQGGGWDHGNNQNLYTFGGANIRGDAALGKIVGRTKRIGAAKTNGQYTSPTDDSYQVEPFSIASTIFSYYGVTNPGVLTGEPAIIESGASAPDNEWQAPV